VELNVHCPDTSSWRGAQLKHRDNFTFILRGQRSLLKLAVERKTLVLYLKTEVELKGIVALFLFNPFILIFLHSINILA
jgi:hypothetical protein